MKCLWVIPLLLNHLIVGDLTLWVLFLLDTSQTYL
jgi:hypothetical protein